VTFFHVVSCVFGVLLAALLVDGSMNFETTPRGTMSKREPQIILKTDERALGRGAPFRKSKPPTDARSGSSDIKK
jgi:hypothetical protein